MAKIPDNPGNWDGIWIFRYEGQGSSAPEHRWTSWEGNGVTRSRSCKDCELKEIAQWVI